MPRRIYSADLVAKYLLSLTDIEDSDVSNLKLQKLCYYAQGIVSAARGAPLFYDHISAWDHGPVVENLYHTYKCYKSSPIPPEKDFDPALFDAADRAALDDIYAYYGQFSPWRLRNMTHEDKPWIDAYARGSSSVISVDDLVSFFRPQLEDDYVKNLYGQEEPRQLGAN